MQIKCPECQARLTLRQPKPGRYRPRCKQCGKLFVVQVGDGNPPRVAVGKLKPEAAAASDAQTATASKPPAGNEAEQIQQATDATVDRTLDSVAANVTVAINKPRDTALDATIESVPPDVAATLDSSAGVTGTPLPAGASQTAGGTDATMDMTTPDGSAAAPSAARIRSGAAGSGPPAASGSAPAQAPTEQADADELAAIPERLGGYRILRMLGRGAMGAVYEAKQISLDRIVALKTIRGRLADNAATLARFTREAYAAAQLTHHNVVQIYDFGEDDGKHYFSMEWVRGGPLSDLIRDKGPLEPRLAIGYTLQAARGLQFAHRSGMVHRDVKPANLLLTDDGIVKVADLGLVKIPDQMDLESDAETASVSGAHSGTHVTLQGTAVGTPAYMAPEQGIDAASVDHRADIYSLGCSLFFLLTGRPPFDGSNVSEVLEQHAKQELPELKQFNARIPDKLQQIIQRAMAKRPDNRYASLAEMIADMESYLGVNAEGKFSPTTQQADDWEHIASKFHRSAPLLAFSGPLLLALTVVAGLLTLAMPFVSVRWLLFGPALFVAAIVTVILMGAGSGHSPVANGFRRWISSLSWFDCAVAVVGTMVFLLVILVAGLWLGVLAGLIIGAIAGATYHLMIIAPSRRGQHDAILEAERFIRDLRIEGADEEGIRSFVARYAGKTWPGIYETLFGYEALCKMREQLSSDPQVAAASTRSGLRDRLCAAFANKANANQQARDLQRLAKVEERGLQSEGVSPDEARERALQMASAIIQDAKRQAAAIQATGGMDAAAAVAAKRARQKEMLAEARSGKYARKADPLAPLKFILGGHTRLLAGCLLLTMFAVWAQSIGLVDTFKQSAQGSADVAEFRSQISEQGTLGSKANILGTEMSGFSIGVAGLLLVMSAFVSGWRMTPFALVATIIILFGPSLGVPGFGTIEAWMIAALAGVAIYLPGVVIGESPQVD
jgi:serine/threonine protein kinase